MIEFFIFSVFASRSRMQNKEADYDAIPQTDTNDVELSLGTVAAKETAPPAKAAAGELADKAEVKVGEVGVNKSSDDEAAFIQCEPVAEPPAAVDDNATALNACPKLGEKMSSGVVVEENHVRHFMMLEITSSLPVDASRKDVRACATRCLLYTSPSPRDS